MILFIGDLSKADAEVLKHHAEKAENILEFGVGGSTQVIRNYAKGNVISFDTSSEWIDRTKENLKLLGIKKEVIFKAYDDEIEDRYDFIFVDGKKPLREQFALRAWPYLRYGGFMAFHDTRKDFHIDYVTEIAKKHFRQIDTIEVNKFESNITVFKKRKALEYVNWNNSENRKPWQYGRGNLNVDEFNKLKNDSEGIQ